MRVLSIACAALLSLACEQPELGPCDPAIARRVVYDDLGSPSFEGQALLITSCGYGAFCHSENIDLEARFGAPIGLEYDLRLAGEAEIDQGEVERLSRMYDAAYADRRMIWREVSRGSMPPWGASVDAFAATAPAYYRVPPVDPMPLLDTDEGREALRNWLACGLPIVERSAVPDDPAYEAIGYAVAPFEVEPLQPEWPSIYQRYVERRCTSSSCHGESAAGELDLRGEDAALQALLTGTAAGDECADTELPLIAPGDPEGSLFFQKLSGRDAAGQAICGERMPPSGRITDASLEGVRLWIANM